MSRYADLLTAVDSVELVYHVAMFTSSSISTRTSLPIDLLRSSRGCYTASLANASAELPSSDSERVKSNWSYPTQGSVETMARTFRGSFDSSLIRPSHFKLLSTVQDTVEKTEAALRKIVQVD